MNKILILISLIAFAAPSAFAGDVDMAFIGRNGDAVESRLTFTEDTKGIHIEEISNSPASYYRSRILDLLPIDRSTEVSMTIDGGDEEVVVVAPTWVNERLIFRGWVQSRSSYLFWE